MPAPRRPPPESRAPQEPHAEGLQVLRLGDHPALRAGHHLCRRARTGRASPTWSTRSPGCWASRARRRCAAARWRTSSSPARRLRRAPAPPLGRAEVTLTIDNGDGALPIDYTEVSITRRMFRDGASEYEINGSSCRLLDIQELLSDSGIGREMHVIVGQGQLDSVLQAKPEDRRGFIEEAAGVLKHRKRKEKALRKLDAMQANLTRLHRPDRGAAPPAQAAGPAGRGGPPGRRPCSPTCATPGCGCWPTTWSGCARRWPARSPTRARSGSGGRWWSGTWPRPRPGRPSWRRRSPPTRRPWPGPRRPGIGCPRWRSASAAPPGWPPSARRHLSADRGRRPARPRPGRDGGRGGRGPRPGGSRCARRWRTTGPGWPRRSPSGRRWSSGWPRRSGRWSPRCARSADRREGLARLGGQVEAVRTRLTAKAEEIDRLAAAAAEARDRARGRAGRLRRAAVRGRRAGRGRARPGRPARDRGVRATTGPGPGCASWARRSGRRSGTGPPGPPARTRWRSA